MFVLVKVVASILLVVHAIIAFSVATTSNFTTSIETRASLIKSAVSTPLTVAIDVFDFEDQIESMYGACDERYCPRTQHVDTFVCTQTTSKTSWTFDDVSLFIRHHRLLI